MIASAHRTMSNHPPAEPSDLPDDLRARFDAWLTAAVARHSPPLTSSEVRRGIQALSSIYVESRGAGRIAERSLQGAAKRAAFATYYTALHFASVHAIARGGALRSDRVRRVLDLGCGTGAAGAAVACALAADSGDGAPQVLGIDRSGWALGQARHTYRAFGLRARTRRSDLPQGLPRADRSTLAVAGWALNELAESERDGVVQWLARLAHGGGRVLVVEPLAGPATRWWRTACDAIGGREGELRLRHARHPWIERMDAAAGLDHRVLGARWLAAPDA